jgi:peptidoglycan L-alanyl-D-glutamate endopeptidase CwlK
MTEQSRRKLAELDPAAQPVFEDFLNRLDEALGDDKYVVHEGRRSSVTQEAYYAQGRKPLEEVNALRKKAWMYLLKSEKENYVITNTLKSKHLLGMAMDVVPVDGRGSATWDLGHYWEAFCTIRDCGRAAGLICGADWPAFTDWPHYEIKG